MISMTMAEFLQAARSNTNDAWAQGETQPLRRSGYNVRAGPSISGILPQAVMLSLLSYASFCRLNLTHSVS